MLIPKENEKDLAEIPDNVKKGLEIIPVSTVDEVLARALVRPLTPIEWPNDLETPCRAKPAEAPAERPRSLERRSESNLRSPGAIRGFVAFGPNLCGAEPSDLPKYGIQR